MMTNDVTTGDQPPTIDYLAAVDEGPSKGHYSKAIGWCCVAMLWGWAMLPGALSVSMLGMFVLFVVIPFVWATQQLVRLIRGTRRRRVSVRRIVTTAVAVVVTLSLGLLDVPLRLTVAISRPFVISAWENTPANAGYGTSQLLGLFLVDYVSISPGGVSLRPWGGIHIEYRARDWSKVRVDVGVLPLPLAQLGDAEHLIKRSMRRHLPRWLRP